MAQIRIGGIYHHFTLRDNIVEYNRQIEENELSTRKYRQPCRTHYRVKLSFEGKIDADKARDMAAEYLRINFSSARAVVAIHHNTAHTHTYT
ncbi:MAG: hypothetical protein ACRD63_01475, partial [Pyrinomonadaceae bacterium]